MKNSRKDPQAERLFLSERESGIYKTTKLEILEEAIAYVQQVANSEWRKKHFPGDFTPRVRNKFFERSEIRNQSAIAFAHANVIFMTKDALNKFLLLHEVGHLLNTRSESYFYNMAMAGKERPKRLGHSAHGVLFARIELDLVLEFLGKDAREALEIAFVKNKVRWCKT